MKKGISKKYKKERSMLPEFEVTESVLQTLNLFRQRDGNETGGILMGSVINESLIRINRISTPCIANANRLNFERDAQKANEYIQQEFEASNQTRIYVGEWHTHPENNPTPSSVDISSIIRIYKTSQIVISGIVFLIIGLKTDYWGYYDGTDFHKIAPKII